MSSETPILPPKEITKSAREGGGGRGGGGAEVGVEWVGPVKETDLLYSCVKCSDHRNIRNFVGILRSDRQ